MIDSAVRHLYVHVPFCPTICPYCDFHVLERRGDWVDRYLDRLEVETKSFAERYQSPLDTVYLGGGTPSFLRNAEITRLVQIIQDNLGWGRLENTLEVNPGTVSPSRARLWHELGLDRASVGIQSLNDSTLQFLGRSHRSKAALEAIDFLLEAGFRVSGDLITAVPGQDIEMDIRKLAQSGVEHISAYTLTIEPGTEFARRNLKVLEEDERAGFTITEQLLTEFGFSRYEVSNYAKTPQARSKHNLAYWNNRFYIGLGPGAAGHLPSDREGFLSRRYTHPKLEVWLKGSDQPEQISPQEYVTDALFMGLRLMEGISLSRLSAQVGFDVERRYASVIDRLIREKLLCLEGHQLRVLPSGFWILNQILTAFLEA